MHYVSESATTSPGVPPTKQALTRARIHRCAMQLTQGRGLDGEQHVGRAGEIIIENRFDREAHGVIRIGERGESSPPPQHRRRAASTQALRTGAHAKVGAEAWVEASRVHGRAGEECELKGSPQKSHPGAMRRKRRRRRPRGRWARRTDGEAEAERRDTA